MPVRLGLFPVHLLPGIYSWRWFNAVPPGRASKGRDGAYIHPPYSCAPRMLICQFPSGAARSGTGASDYTSAALALGEVLLWI